MEVDEYDEEFNGNRPSSPEEASQWREGWGLWTRSDGFYEIQKFDEDPSRRFSSDDQAVQHVRARARSGSTMHVRAVALHGRRYA